MMKFAIIAAGEGARLASEGITTPKPLVNICGEPVIDRLMRSFIDCEAEEIVVLYNDSMPEVKKHLEHILQDGLDGRSVPLRFMGTKTPSSMHSFFEISPLLANAPFCLTTVDTIFNHNDFARFIDHFRQSVKSGDTDGMMAVTDFIDDESPLYIETDDQLNISAFLDKQNGKCKYISGGIYALSPQCLKTLENCIQRGESRMRNYQRALLKDGLRLKAYPFHQIFDIDHATDIEKAEKILAHEH